MNSAIMMLEETARKFGGRTAVSDTRGEISFSQLRASALSLATGLLAAGGGGNGPEPVLVYLPKSIESIVTFCGAMYSGNPYVPVDSAIPPKRLLSIVGSMSSGHIITNEELKNNLNGVELGNVKLRLYGELTAAAPDEDAVMNKASKIIDADPVYIMYTSGSTGVPKGVTIPHRGIIDYADWLKSTFAFDENTVLGNQSAFYFDNSTLDIFTMLYTGAKLVLIPEALFRYPAKLPDFINESGINAICWVPTVMIAVANSGVLENIKMPLLKKVLFCGEVMPNRQLNVWRKYQPDKLYANMYGPTEITDVCTCYVVDREFDDAAPLPIGKACRNMRILILTEDGRPAKAGETGELCVLGSALARGYWNAPELTRKAFTQNPLCTEYDDRMYRTGDLAYVDGDGLIMFVGRADTQIKYRGNRVELGEIETAARSAEKIGNACVLFDGEREEIVLFAETEEALQLRQLNLELRKLIPGYMLPGRLVCMKALPQTPNGKIDRVFLKSILREHNI